MESLYKNIQLMLEFRKVPSTLGLTFRTLL